MRVHNFAGFMKSRTRMNEQADFSMDGFENDYNEYEPEEGYGMDFGANPEDGEEMPADEPIEGDEDGSEDTEEVTLEDLKAMIEDLTERIEKLEGVEEGDEATEDGDETEEGKEGEEAPAEGTEEK